MTATPLPDRRIDVPIHQLLSELDEAREIDRRILEELCNGPATTGYLARRIDEQPNYVSQRLGIMAAADDGSTPVLTQLEVGYYEFNPEVITHE